MSDRALVSCEFKLSVLHLTLWWCTAPVSRPEIGWKQHQLWHRHGWGEEEAKIPRGRLRLHIQWIHWYDTFSWVEPQAEYWRAVWTNGLRWVSLLLLALVLLPQLLSVDIQRLVGINGQQHVANVRLWRRKKNHCQNPNHCSWSRCDAYAGQLEDFFYSEMLTSSKKIVVSLS